MAIPSYKDVDLALLLELVREGGPVRPAESYGRVASHFPDLTEADLAATRKDGRTKAFQNVVHWGRDHLRVLGLLDSDQPGIWKVSKNARQALIDMLLTRGVAVQAAAIFVDSDRTLPEVLGPRWSTPTRARAAARPTPVVATARPTPGSTQVESPAEDSNASRGAKDREAVRSAIIRRLNAMPGYEFEQIVARVLDGVGLRDSQVVGRSGDEGVDILAYLHSPFVTAKVAVQVKRHSANVGPKDISYLRDRWAKRADRLLFVTTSDYTGGAREVAEDPDKPVALVTGAELVDIMVEHGLGIRQRPVVELEIDDDFFSG